MNNEPPVYPAPLDQLLSLGQPPDNAQLDYAGLGISSENIPDLIRLATDEQFNGAPGDGPLVWAPVHAWRILGQLRAVSAVAPLLQLLRRIDEYEDDWIGSDLPEVLARMGAAAIEPAVHYLADVGNGQWARIAVSDTLGKIGQTHPELRAACVGKLAAQLEHFSEQTETLNAFLVLSLWDLQAVAAMPVIERAYAADCVDESVVGDVEDVQIHFGLKTEREHPARSHSWGMDWTKGPDTFDQGNDESRLLLDEPADWPAPEPYIAPVKIGRNEPCPCGSGKKYKKCCGG